MSYHAVPVLTMKMPVHLPRRTIIDTVHLTDDDPARAAMTDFLHVQPVTVVRERHIDVSRTRLERSAATQAQAA